MDQTIQEMIALKAEAARDAMRNLSNTTVDVRNSALLAMADSILAFKDKIREANQIDLENGQKTGLAEPLMNRLLVDEKKIARMADNLRQVAGLPDPIGEVTRMWERPNGLRIGTVRVPIGVVGVIFESRPDVTVEVSALCIKSGNGVILRGGSEAIRSNTALANILSETAEREGIKDVIQFVDITDRQAVREMIALPEHIDLIVPRGSYELVRSLMRDSEIPVLGHADGVCHVYVDEAADPDMAEQICFNAKVGYTRSPCATRWRHCWSTSESLRNSFHRMCERFAAEGVELRGCEKTQQMNSDIVPATEADWRTEYLDKILSIRVVSDFDEAVHHIETYGSHHSDSIITENYAAAQRFLKEVDSAAVYVNASTAFTDGYEFGLGAEVGISTQKLHCRGPMGLEGLTSYKYIIYGNGQVRT